METSDIEIARMQSFEGLKQSMREYVVNMLASTNDTEGLTFDPAAAWKKLLQICFHDLFQGDESAFGNRNPPQTVGRNLEADEQRLI